MKRFPNAMKTAGTVTAYEVRWDIDIRSFPPTDRNLAVDFYYSLNDPDAHFLTILETKPQRNRS